MRPGSRSALERSTASVRSPRRMPISSTPRAPPSGSTCAAGSRTPSSWPSSACFWRPGPRRRHRAARARAIARRRAIRRGAHRDAAGLLRRRRERDCGGATPAPRDADGGLPARKDRVAPWPSARRPEPTAPLDRAAGAPPALSRLSMQAKRPDQFRRAANRCTVPPAP